MNYWIFKCDPTKYRLDDRLKDPHPHTTWRVSRYRDEIRTGDIAFIWQTGKERGLRAVLRVDADPYEMEELSHEQRFQAEPDHERCVRVACTLTHRFPLIPAASLKSIEALQNMPVFQGFQQATNFRLTLDEGNRLMSLIV
jgi:predicted RNA-binding protein with PUA-like domain